MEKWEAAKRAKTNPFNDSCTKSFFTYTITVLDSVEWIVKIYLKSNEERQSSPQRAKKGLSNNPIKLKLCERTHSSYCVLYARTTSSHNK